jgi:hypothetical protein
MSLLSCNMGRIGKTLLNLLYAGAFVAAASAFSGC